MKKVHIYGFFTCYLNGCMCIAVHVNYSKTRQNTKYVYNHTAQNMLDKTSEDNIRQHNEHNTRQDGT
jgi:hypothetical protein